MPHAFIGARGSPWVAPWQLPHVVLVCNFPDPAAQSGPALLDHSEEEWIFDASVLRRFARHVETGEVIAVELVDSLRAARAFGRGLFAQWLLFRSEVSLALHDRKPDDIETTELVFEVARRYLPYEVPSGTHYEASFDHLAQQSAAYYTYLWSQAIAKDLLSAFTNGLLDLEQTRRFRDLVLAPGGTRPAAAVLADFLGRPVAVEPLARWLQAESHEPPPGLFRTCSESR